MTAVLLTVTALFAYFCGSLSTPVLDSNLFFHYDLRKFSHDNLGITRFLNKFGKKGFLILFATEAVKTIVPVVLGGLLMLIVGHGPVGRAVALFCVTLGTVFPIMYGFKGEHSIIAVPVGMLFISTGLSIAMVIVFAIVYYLTRKVSAGLLTADITLIALTFLSVDDMIVRRLIFATAALILIEYRKSFLRLLKGDAPTFVYKKDISYMFDEDY